MIKLPALGHQYILPAPKSTRHLGKTAVVCVSLIALASASTASADDTFRFTSKDAALLLGGAAAAGVGAFLLDSRIQDVPPEGLNPDDIALEWDRDALRIPNANAKDASSAFLLGAGAAPTGVFTVAGGEGRTWSAAGRMWTVQAEATLIATGVSFLVKRAASRPRPFTYLPESQRPSGYDASNEEAFESFPSNHATVAWAGGMSGASYLAFTRPDLAGSVHFLSGALVGGFATATGILRVDAGMHFPTDVVVGSVLGLATGIGIAAFNHPHTEGNTGAALRNCLLGAAAGTVVAILFTPPASPWVD
jgi:membrane-associated phospholipid phosphatase